MTADPVAVGRPTPGPLSLAGLASPRFVHWFEGRPESRLLVVRDRAGAVLATWRPPDDAEIWHLAEALSPDGHYLTWLSGDRPDGYLAGPLEPPLTLHIQDLLTGQKVFQRVLLHPGLLDDLRQQVFTVEGWGGPTESDWTPSWERPTPQPGVEEPRGAEWYSLVIAGVFDDGIGRTVWSPDGSQLAVVAALDGPTSDLYLVDRVDFTMRRLTREPEHVTRLEWSPNSRNVLYSAGLEGRRFNASTVFAGWVDYLVDVSTGASLRDPTAQPEPRRPGGPWMNTADTSLIGNIEDAWPVGWTSDGAAIVMPIGEYCSNCRLDLMAPGSVAPTGLVSSVHGLNVVSMPQGDRVVVTEDDRSPDGGTPQSGTFLLHIPDLKLETVDSTRRFVETWGLDDFHFFYFRGTPRPPDAVATTPPFTLTAFGPGGHRLEIEDPPAERPVVSQSPDRAWRVACGGEACKVYGTGPRPVGGWTGLPVDRPANGYMFFAPDSTQLVLLSHDQLYLVDLPDGRPRRLTAWTRERPGGGEATYWLPLSDALGWFGGAKGVRD